VGLDGFCRGEGSGGNEVSCEGVHGAEDGVGGGDADGGDAVCGGEGEDDDQEDEDA